MTATPRTIDIDFLYIDLTTCSRCKGTDENLGHALDAVRSVLSAAGVSVNLRKVLIDTPEKAVSHRFASSPTIRVNGRDVALQTKESRCGSCGDIAGEATDCRVWTYEGVEYTEAPAALLVDAILRAVYGSTDSPAAEPQPYAGVPENLVRFFEAKAANASGPCCPTSGPSEACCAPSETALPAIRPTAASCCSTTAA